MSKEARPISLRQLMVFGRSLNEQRLVSSANYVRTELPRRYVIWGRMSTACERRHSAVTAVSKVDDTERYCPADHDLAPD